MTEFKKPSEEYSDYLADTFFKYFRQKNFKEGISYFNELYEPQNMFFRSYNSDIAQGFVNTLEEEKILFKKFKHYFKKIWHGEDLTGKTIFIFNYICGYGNYIMYSRYIPIIEKMAGKVIIEADNNLYDLFKYNYPNCEIVRFSDDAYKGKYDYTSYHDYFINFQKDTESFPNPEGYLKASPELIKEFAPIFNTDKLKVGVFHEGIRRTKIDYYYSLTDMLPVFSNRNCQFYTLNNEYAMPETQEIHKEYNVIELQPYIKNAFDTAALMKNLDLVITVDSFAAHLAGALGIKTYLLLHDNPCWRYFNDYYTTPWYDSVKIIRRTPYSYKADCIYELLQCLNKECMEHRTQCASL